MPPAHRETDKRYCSADTIVVGQQTFQINSLKAAVESDLDDHSMLGALISASPGTYFINNKKAIVAMMDRAAPDAQGGIIHPFSPTDPAQGSPNFFIYDGKAGGGLSQIMSGKLNIGEMLQLDGNIVGQVKNMMGGLMGGKGGAGSQGNLVMQNMGGYTPKAGDVLTGTETGGQIQVLNFTRSSAYDRQDTAPDYTPVLEASLADDTNVIAMPEHFTGYSTQDYQTEHILTL